MKWAFLFILAQMLWMLLERLVGLHDVYIEKHATYTLFFGLVAILIYVFAILDKRKTYYGNRLSYKQGFVSGLFLTFFVTLLTPITQWIISTIITPDYFTNIIEYSVSKGYFKTIAEAESEFNLSNYMIQSTIGALVMGVFTSAIVAIFTKRK